MRVLQLKAGCLDADHVEGVENMGSMGSMGSQSVPSHQDAEPAQAAHGINMDQNHLSMGSQRSMPQPPSIFDPIDPIRSHEWDHNSTAPQCAETNCDPIDPMNHTPITHHAHAHASVPRARPRVNLVRPAPVAEMATPQDIHPAPPVAERIADLDAAVAIALATGESSLTRMLRQLSEKGGLSDSPA
jgi:hypothetical protein